MHLEAKGKCSGCCTCLLACSAINFGIFNPEKALLRVKKEYPNVKPIVCLQKPDAPCIINCPNNAIYYDGIVRIDRSKCTGCGACLEACPLNVIKIINGKAWKCELCNGDPECVKHCTLDVLRFEKK